MSGTKAVDPALEVEVLCGQGKHSSAAELGSESDWPAKSWLRWTLTLRQLCNVLNVSSALLYLLLKSLRLLLSWSVSI